jgi:hypothetical protein
MAFTKITAAGIGSTETVTLDGVAVINNESIGGNLTVTGNATIGGVLTYEDVTNVDSVGVITARAGVLVGSGITLSKDGDIFATGVTTSTTFVGNLTGTADLATQFTVVANNTNDQTTFPVFVDAATGSQGAETDTGLTYNPLTGNLTATKFTGDGSALTGLQAGKFLSDGIGITTVTPVGIETTSLARKDLTGPAGNTATGAGSSFHGAYMGDGFLSFNTEFSNSSGYYISTFTNALVAGPMQLGSTLTIDGNFTIV